MATNEAAYLHKANESLAGAISELASGRYNNCANRSYYACFQAAIAALIRAEVRPAKDGDWPHPAVQAQFVATLINRRKSIPSEFRSTLSRLILLREIADYDVDDVSELQATRMVRQARAFVAAVERNLNA